jgi:photosystem II stability/assembly factor-like uncharacterized protein
MDKEEIEMKATTRVGSVLILVGLMVVLSFPGLTGAEGGGANVIRGDDCTISLVELGGDDVTTTDTQSVETPSGNLSLVCRADLPDDLDPPRRALRTSGELCETPLGPTTNTVKVITPAGKVRLTCRVNGKPPPTSGWIIGDDATNTAVIVHTADGGLTWQVQGDSTAWTGRNGNDISAVDDRTAWAALGSAGETGGAILHTTDGGATWVTQTIPAGLYGGIKAVKGLSRREAWAASPGGTILHTTDGGTTWNIVPHPAAPITAVNRMDAMGTNVWIADVTDPAAGAVVHTQDGGLTWRVESLPDDSPMTVSAFSPQVVWSSGEFVGAFYRTVNGGDLWVNVIKVAGWYHLDDVCAASADDAWGVLNEGASGGSIWRVHVAVDGTPDAKSFKPHELLRYVPGGVTCLDTRVAWVVAQQGRDIDPTKPLGIILHTTDGGETWVQQSAPTHVHYWKVSFAGARR